MSAINNVTSHIWYNRLGLLSFQKIELLKDQLHLTCNGYKQYKFAPCSVCPLAKQRRLSFVSNNHFSHNAFDLIHCDTWGPYHAQAHAGHRFFLTLVDNCTRFTWIYLMKQKSHAESIIPKFFKMIETQLHNVIKAFRSDNAPELKFVDFFASKGVIHQFTCVKRP